MNLRKKLSIYLFPVNEGDNDQVFTGLAYDSLSGRVFLSSPKVSGRQVAVSYFRIEDYTPGSQPRLMPFPYFESGSSSVSLDYNDNCWCKFKLKSAFRYLTVRRKKDTGCPQIDRRWFRRQF